MSALDFDQITRGFLSYLKVECGLSANTIEAYSRDLRDLVADLEAQDVRSAEEITPRHLAQHIINLKRERGMAASSIARHLATIRMLFRFLVSERRLERDPTEPLERPSRWQRLPGVLSERNILTLVRTPAPPANEDSKSLPLWLRDRALLETMYACGLRASEVGDLPLNDVHFTLGVMKVTGKGSKQRLVPFGKPCEKALSQYLDDCRPRLVKPDGRDKGRVFLSRTGRPLERVAVWQIVKKHAEAAGLKDVYPHLIRHTFATHLLTGGADLRVVQELLGHANIATTQIYTRVDAPRLREVHRRYHPRG